LEPFISLQFDSQMNFKFFKGPLVSHLSSFLWLTLTVALLPCAFGRCPLPLHDCQLPKASHVWSTRVLRRHQLTVAPHATSLPLPLPLAITGHTMHIPLATRVAGRIIKSTKPFTCYCQLHFSLLERAHASSFLCRHYRRAHLTIAPPLHCTLVLTNTQNGSALAPRCFHTQPRHRSRSQPAAFQLFPAGCEQYHRHPPIKIRHRW
jgi:hypothetical protein